MRKDAHNSGFGVVRGILLLVVAGIIGFTTWYVIDAKRNADASYANAAKSSQSTVVKSTSKKDMASTADSYAGWNNYCDDNGGCFKYPADWMPVTSGPKGAEPGNFKNPQQTLKLVSGMDPSNGDYTIPAVYFTNKIESLATTNNALKVWGGYLDEAYVPQYAVVDASRVSSTGLSVGRSKSTMSDTYTSYTDKKSDKPYGFGVFATNGNFTKTNVADWFDSPDGKLALKIVQSFYYK